MRHANQDGFIWCRRWTAPDFLRLFGCALAASYCALRLFGKI
jgi:hypothetical protein